MIALLCTVSLSRPAFFHIHHSRSLSPWLHWVLVEIFQDDLASALVVKMGQGICGSKTASDESKNSAVAKYTFILLETWAKLLSFPSHTSSRVKLDGCRWEYKIDVEHRTYIPVYIRMCIQAERTYEHYQPLA